MPYDQPNLVRREEIPADLGLGTPAIGIPQEWIDQIDLEQEEVFERNWESQPVRVIEGLLSTAAEYPASHVSLHMKGKLSGVREGAPLSSKEVLKALHAFADQQVLHTGDDAWRAVRECLDNHFHGREAVAEISRAVLAYMKAHAAPERKTTPVLSE